MSAGANVLSRVNPPPTVRAHRHEAQELSLATRYDLLSFGPLTPSAARIHEAFFTSLFRCPNRRVRWLLATAWRSCGESGSSQRTGAGEFCVDFGSRAEDRAVQIRVADPLRAGGLHR